MHYSGLKLNLLGSLLSTLFARLTVRIAYRLMIIVEKIKTINDKDFQ